MKMFPVAAEVFHVAWWTDRQTNRYDEARENNKKEQVYLKNIKHAGQFLATRVHHKLRNMKVTNHMIRIWDVVMEIP